jgi:hypothetical protein
MKFRECLIFVFLSDTEELKIKIFKIIIVTVVLNRHETWSLTMREECRLLVFEIRMLKKINRPNRKRK